MPDYKNFPLEFAQGILSMRSSLATQRAQLREMQEDRRVKQELELAKIGIEQAALSQQGAIANADRAAKVSIANKQGDIEMARHEAQVQQETKDLELRRTSVVNQATSKWGLEPVFLDRETAGSLKPAQLQDENVRVIHDEQTGGLWVLPSKATQSSQIGLFQQKQSNLVMDQLLKGQRMKTLQAQERQYLQKMKTLGGMGQTTLSKAIAGSKTYMNTIREQAAQLMNDDPSSEAYARGQEILNTGGRSLYKKGTKEYERAETNLLIDDAINRGVLQQLEAFQKQNGPDAYPDEPIAAHGPLAQDFFEQQRDLLRPLVEGESRDESQTGLRTGYPDVGVFDSATGQFQSMKGQPHFPKRGGVAYRIPYTDQSGQEVGHVVHSDGGGVIYSAGRVPGSSGVPKSGGPDSGGRLLPDTSAPGAAPDLKLPAGEDALKRITELEAKVERGETLTPDEAAEIRALLGGQ